MGKRVEQIRLLLTAEEKKKIEEMAKSEYLDMNTYIRRKLFKGE